MKSGKTKIIIGVLAVVLIVGICVAIVFSSKQDLEDAQNDLQQSYEKYGIVEKETVEVLVSKFNTEVVDNSSLNPASNDYLSINQNQYWYGLIEGIYLVVVPEEFKNDKTTEIVDYMYLYVDKTGQYEKDAKEYAEYLVKANHNEFTSDEIEYLLTESKNLSSSQTMANNGKGISVGYVEVTEHYEYQVQRLYK